MPTLYSFFNSSTSYRIRIALSLKNIDYEYRAINIRIGEQCDPAYVMLNPSEGVPLWVDDNIRLSQSMAILQYIEDVYGGMALLPTDPILKARILQFCNAIACDIHPMNNLKSLNYLSTDLGVSHDGRKRWYAHWIAKGLAACEQLLTDHHKGAYCFGEIPTWADCCLIPQIANAQRQGCRLDAYPKLIAIYGYAMQQPAFQAAAPEQQPDFTT